MTNEEFIAMVQEIPPIICRGEHDAAQLHAVAHVKRFAEYWVADPVFREKFLSDKQATLLQHSIDVCPADATLLTGTGVAFKDKQPSELSRPLQQHFAYFYEKLQNRQALQTKKCVPDQPKFREWRQRQLNRCWGELGSNNMGFIHVPLVFELSQGCSMGCPFCALAAAKLTGVFMANAENLVLWRDVLVRAKAIIGAAAGSGVCYCATEPLDNPDYEKFSRIYEEIFAVVPQVTTAAAMREPERTRKFLQSGQKNPTVHRFSVLSLALFRRICQTFTPEELLYVELLPRFPEASAYNQITKAGRAWAGEDSNIAQTISCATGFIVNMVEKSIRLTTPCNADALHPTGEMISGKTVFTDAADFAKQLTIMIDKYMVTALPKDKIIKFPDYYTFIPEQVGFSLASKAKLKVRFKSATNSGKDVYNAVGKLIQDKCWTARSMAAKLLEDSNIEPAEVFYCINYLYKKGFLSEN